jgi:hypothetical protein
MSCSITVFKLFMDFQKTYGEVDKEELSLVLLVK